MRDYPAKKFSFSLYDRQHIQNLAKQAVRLDKIFKDAIAKGTKIGEASGFCNPDGEFMFDNYPALKDRVEKFFTALHDNLLLTITEGNREEWLLAAAKNSAMVDAYYKKAKKKYGQQAEEWTERHMEGLKAFNNRVEKGMNLSDRVWKMTKQFKQELELALEMGLGEGKSAAVLSKDVRQYLNEPHKLFRRVRDKKGQLRLSKAAAAYHPGTGVYRSSYMNALRLTATENNIAYRTSDYDRWQQMDFVTGIQIKLSNNHTLNGKPFVDICDHLKGYYPKDFKFVGWHPFCRCIAVPKLADEDEFIERQQALIDGDPAPDKPYSGEITTLPKNFTNWVEENAEKIETARSKPYFITDNQQQINPLLQHPVKVKTARTAEQAAKIQTDWNQRRKDNFFDELERYHITAQQAVDMGKKFNILDASQPKEFERIFAELKAEFEVIRKNQTTDIGFSKQQKALFGDMANTWGIKRVRPMTTYEADQQDTNPDYKPKTATSINCQTCAPAYMLRLQGFDIKATPNIKGSLNEYLAKNNWEGTTKNYTYNSFKCWKNADGTDATPITIADWATGKGYKGALTADKTLQYLEETTKKPGVYELVLAWKAGGAHATILQRFEDGTLARIEPQVFNGSMKRDVKTLTNLMKTQLSGHYFGGIMRIDDKILDRKYWSIFVKK